MKNDENELAILNQMGVGFFVTLFSFFKRKTDEQYGGGWTVIWKPRSQL